MNIDDICLSPVLCLSVCAVLEIMVGHFPTKIDVCLVLVGQSVQIENDMQV